MAQRTLRRSGLLVNQLIEIQLDNDQLDSGLEDAIGDATNGNFALGSEGANDQISAALNRRVMPGRPKKAP